jgi:adenine/guanine phosphoribosyltransferase-like PRPP-binding protein
MQAGRRLGKVNIQLNAVTMLRVTRSLYRLSYRELSGVLGIPESLICRYTNGDLLPSRETALSIISKLSPMLDLGEVVRRLVRVSDGYVDLSGILFNPHVLRLFYRRIEEKFSGLGITRVLTAATDGIPLSVMAAYALDAELAVAKQYKDLAFEEFYEVNYIVDSPPRRASLYLPTNLLGRGDNVLVVDDIVRSGRTLDALASLVDMARARLVGICVLISMSDSWVSRMRNRGVDKIDIVLRLG